MTKLEATLLAIKDGSLVKEQLDVLYSDLAQLRSDVKMEMATLLKEKAMFMLRNPELSIAQRKVNWDGSDNGQRLIELRSYVSAIGDAMEGVKTRIYALL